MTENLLGPPHASPTEKIRPKVSDDNVWRLPVVILGYLAAGNSPEQIIAEFPDLKTEQIAACSDYARELADFEVAV